MNGLEYHLCNSVSHFQEQNPKLAGIWWRGRRSSQNHGDEFAVSYRFRPNYVIVKRVVHSHLGGVLVEPSEDGEERGGTKGRGIAFDWNVVAEAEAEAAAEVEAVGMAAVVQ